MAERITPGTEGSPVKYRIVFNSGRDLNIFNVVRTDLHGQWNRYYSDDGREYIVDPAKVNYIEIRPL